MRWRTMLLQLLWLCALAVHEVLSEDIFDISRIGDLASLQDLLLDNEDDVANSFDEDGIVPLMLGAKMNRFDIVSELLKAGANVNAVENKGKSALYFAVESNFADVAQLLLESGADPEIYALDGQSPMTLGMELSHLPMVDYLQEALTQRDAALGHGEEEGEDPDAATYYQPTPEKGGSPRSTKFGETDAESYYGSDGGGGEANSQKPSASPTVTSSSDSTALYTAISTADSTLDGTAVVTLMTAKATKQVQLLELARDGKVVEMEDLFKDESIEVDLENDNGWTALVFAASQGQAAAVKCLIKHGADVGHHESDGWTSLMFASYIGHKDVVDALLRANASVLDKADSGVNVLDAALLNEHYDPDVVTELASMGLREALNLRKTKDIMAMVVKGADLETKGEHDWTALLYFASSGNLEGVRAVLDRCKAQALSSDKNSKKARSKIKSSFTADLANTKASAKPDIKPSSFGSACDIRTVINQVEAVDGWTSLMFAASLNTEEMVRRLLLAGSDTRMFSKTERPQTAGHLDLSIGKTFGSRMSSQSSGLGMTAISIALDRGYTYLADMIRRGDVLAQERAGSEIGRLMKFRALKETQAMELARQDEINKSSHDDRGMLDPVKWVEMIYDNVRYILN